MIWRLSFYGFIYWSQYNHRLASKVIFHMQTLQNHWMNWERVWESWILTNTRVNKSLVHFQLYCILYLILQLSHWLNYNNVNVFFFVLNNDQNSNVLMQLVSLFICSNKFLFFLQIMFFFMFSSLSFIIIYIAKINWNSTR